MQPIKNVDHFIQQMEFFVENRDAAKMRALLDVHQNFLQNFHNPAYAARFEQLSRRIAQAEQLDIANLVSEYAKEFRFPSELMAQVVSRFVQEEPMPESAAIKRTSKEIRQAAIAAFRGCLTVLKIQTAEQAIQFVQEHGQRLTYLDITGITFSKKELVELLNFIPNVETFIAERCDLNADGAKAIASSQSLKKLRTLDLSSNFIERGIPSLAASQNLKKLHTLILKDISLTPTSFQAIANSEMLENLERLTLSGLGIPALASSKTLTKLRELNLYSTSLDANEAQLLANSLALKNLERLFIEGHRSQEGLAVAQALAASHMTNLTDLSLRFIGIGEAGAAALAQTQTLTKLERLDLSYNSIGDGGIAALAHSPVIKNLKELNVTGTNIGKNGAEAIALSQVLTHLQSLDLHDNSIGPEGMVALSRSPTLANLSTLYLERNGIGPLGAKALAESPFLRNLKKLSLFDNQIEGEGVKALASSQTLTGLQQLLVDSNLIDDEGAIAIASSSNFTQLQYLNLSNNKIGSRGAAAIAHSENLKNLKDLRLINNLCGIEEEIAIAQSETLQNLHYFVSSKINDPINRRCDFYFLTEQERKLALSLKTVEQFQDKMAAIYQEDKPLSQKQEEYLQLVKIRKFSPFNLGEFQL